MPITIRKEEWTYDNLGTEGYNSSSMLEPYETWLLNEAVSTETESFSAGDGEYARAAQREDTESVKVSDSSTRRYDKKTDGDKFTVGDSSARSADRRNDDRFGIKDGEYARAAQREDTESVKVSDNYNRSADRRNEDLIIKFNELSSRFLDRGNDDRFGIKDESTLRKVERKDSINILFSEDDTRSFVRTTVDDKFFLWDDAVFTATNVETGEVAEGEQIEKGGSINLFDFEISPETDFDTWISENCPVNYGEVRPFIPGEYEYTDAYVGFTLAIPPTDGRFGVAGSTVWIDVEDTVEKGTAETKGGKLERISFSKRFYTPPHIMTSLNYAAENCYIEVKNVTRDYFEFGLKSIASGEYLNGEINWLADGY